MLIDATAAAGGAVAAVAIAAGAAAAAAVAIASGAAAGGFGTVAIALLVGGGSIKGGERSHVAGRRSGEETRDVDISAREILRVFSYEMRPCCSLRSAKAFSNVETVLVLPFFSLSISSYPRLCSNNLTSVQYSSLVNFR